MALTDKLTAIADQVRRLSNTESPLTLDGMEATLQGVKASGELYNAEEYLFGVADDATEYAITGVTSLSKGGNNSYHMGWKFKVLSAFSVKGFRIANYAAGNLTSFTPKLYRLSDSKLIASASMTCAYGATADVLLDAPVNLTVGETYAVVVYNNPSVYVNANSVTINSKISYVTGVISNSSNITDILASSSNGSIYGLVFPIMGDPINADIPTEYKVQMTTMNEIAEEVQRITGTTEKMNTAQIIAALQGLNITLQEKTVTPAETAQTVTPDSGYYGLSSVTVEAIPATESEATE